MQFLVFSDSHGQDHYMLRALALNPDVHHVLFLGDGLADIARVAARRPDLDIRAVRGNMDGLSLDHPAEDESLFSLFGVNVLLMHGHLRGVKGGLGAAEAHAAACGARVLLFGHTHLPYNYYNSETGLYSFNPGSIGRPWSGPPTFGLLDILPNGQLSLSHGNF